MLSTKSGTDFKKTFSKSESTALIKIENDEQEKYKKKCKQIKKLIKELIYENVSLCDQIAYLQEKTLQLIDERNYLFKKLYTYQPHSKSITELDYLPVRPHLPLSVPETRKNIPKKRNDSNSSFEVIKAAASKPTKRPPQTKKKKIVKPIPLDSFGKPIFPIILGEFTVHSLGEVNDKPAYHTEDILFPVGYCSSRIYGSPKDPEKQCVYTCKVMDGASSPRFEIVADTDMDLPIVSSSIDQCHSALLQRINNTLGSEVVNTKGRGAEFFGLSHPYIHQLLQSSPGVRKCRKYIPTKFEVNPNFEYTADEVEASLSYNALLRSISFSKSHLEPMMKQEQGHDFSSEDNVTALRNILLS